MVQVGAETEEKLRTEIHKKTFEILRPEILKMRELMDFHEQAIGVIKNNIQLLVKPEQAKATHSEEILDAIVKVTAHRSAHCSCFSALLCSPVTGCRCIAAQGIDMLVLLDALKDMKACLLNDFSRYKR